MLLKNLFIVYIQESRETIIYRKSGGGGGWMYYDKKKNRISTQVYKAHRECVRV